MALPRWPKLRPLLTGAASVGGCAGVASLFTLGPFALGAALIKSGRPEVVDRVLVWLVGIAIGIAVLAFSVAGWRDWKTQRATFLTSEHTILLAMAAAIATITFGAVCSGVAWLRPSWYKHEVTLDSALVSDFMKATRRDSAKAADAFVLLSSLAADLENKSPRAVLASKRRRWYARFLDRPIAIETGVAKLQLQIDHDVVRLAQGSYVDDWRFKLTSPRMTVDFNDAIRDRRYSGPFGLRDIHRGAAAGRVPADSLAQFLRARAAYYDERRVDITRLMRDSLNARNTTSVTAFMYQSLLDFFGSGPGFYKPVHRVSRSLQLVFVLSKYLFVTVFAAALVQSWIQPKVSAPSSRAS
jgi:hypothetical protein